MVPRLRPNTCPTPAYRILCPLTTRGRCFRTPRKRAPSVKSVEDRGIFRNGDRAQSLMFRAAASYLAGPSAPVLTTAASGESALGHLRARSAAPQVRPTPLLAGDRPSAMERNVNPRALYRMDMDRRARIRATTKFHTHVYALLCVSLIF